MNNLTSGQRKLVYGLGILALMVVVIALGKPSDGSPGTGGVVSELREKYSLGEATLGQVDPASSTMNLVLLGFRGIAASILWSEAEHHRVTKNWSKLHQTAESIILLQPHFKKVWEYQAWNLGFNVSAGMDALRRFKTSAQVFSQVWPYPKMALVSRHSSMPKTPYSRPFPDCL